MRTGKAEIVPPAREQLLPVVGPPLLDSFHKYYGMDQGTGHTQAIKAGIFYRPGLEGEIRLKSIRRY